MIAPRARDSYAYLLVTNLSLKNGTIRFLARGAQEVDALDTPVDRLSAPPAGLGAVFIVSPDRSDTLQSIERLYPGGRLQMIRQAQTKPFSSPRTRSGQTQAFPGLGSTPHVSPNSTSPANALEIRATNEQDPTHQSHPREARWQRCS